MNVNKFNNLFIAKEIYIMGGTSIPPSTAPAREPLPINNPTPPAAETKPEPTKTCLAERFDGSAQGLHDAGGFGRTVNLGWAVLGAFGAYPNSGRDCPKSPTQTP